MMKITMTFSKVMMTMLFLCASGFLFAGNKPSDYIFETKVDKGLIIEKTAYLPTDKGKLLPVQKYEFAYENNEMVSRITYSWDKRNKEWIKRVDMDISRNNNEITAERKLWDNSGQLISNERMIYLGDKEKGYEPQFLFVKDQNTNNWILKNEKSMLSLK